MGGELYQFSAGRTMGGSFAILTSDCESGKYFSLSLLTIMKAVGLFLAAEPPWYALAALYCCGFLFKAPPRGELPTEEAERGSRYATVRLETILFSPLTFYVGISLLGFSDLGEAGRRWRMW